MNTQDNIFVPASSSPVNQMCNPAQVNFSKPHRTAKIHITRAYYLVHSKCWIYVNYLPSFWNCSKFIFTWKHSHHISVTHDLMHSLVIPILFHLNVFTFFSHPLIYLAKISWALMCCQALCPALTCMYFFWMILNSQELGTCFNLLPPPTDVAIVRESLS